MYIFPYFISLLLSFLIFVDCYQIRVQKQWFRYPGNPGVKIRLTKKGANHVKSMGVHVFNEYISKLRDYSTSLPFPQIGLNGVVNLKKLRVTNYHPPHLSVLNFLPPRHIVLGLENLDVSLSSDFVANVPPLTFEGSLDGSIIGMTIAVTTELLTDTNGRMNAIVRNCSALVDRSHVTLNPTGPMGLLVKTFENSLNDSVKKRIPEIFCARLQNLLEKNVAKLFDNLIKIDLKEYFPKIHDNLVVRDVFSSFMSQFSHGMFIDNKMISQPFITMDYIETNHLGETRFPSSSHSTPFYPRPMELPESSGDSMVHFYISDHIFNTMLYQAYQDNRLSMKIDETNLPSEMSSFVATSCPTRKNPTILCVGHLISQIGKSYPNSTASFVILPHGLPYVMINPNAVSIDLSNRILTYVQPESDRLSQNKTQILVFSINGQADIIFDTNEKDLNAKLNMNRFNIRLHRSSVRGIDESSIARLSPLSKSFITPRLNAAIQKAVKFPAQDTIKFINPKLKNFEGFMALSSDFELNREKIMNYVMKTLI
ncbi:unnamed protein product [Caenorhabditis angaria]|uniref:Lipid-binding serum glycoprotein C-terminal domain-containing protein n=1 Tax=Caenorhabditis angaria TaxID=860376 RepID=A0A9P1IX35_9PELO|nr:unnamed protein product [Caenorhabditis angaria]